MARFITANWVVSVPPKARSATINAAVLIIRQNLRVDTVAIYNLLMLPTISRTRRRRPFNLWKVMYRLLMIGRNCSGIKAPAA
jgi:hypothetical protein